LESLFIDEATLAQSPLLDGGNVKLTIWKSLQYRSIVLGPFISTKSTFLWEN